MGSTACVDRLAAASTATFGATPTDAAFSVSAAFFAFASASTSFAASAASASLAACRALRLDGAFAVSAASAPHLP